jgi:hypothetical protein
MEQKGVDALVRWMQKSTARKLCLPREFESRLDVIKAIANNHSITTLDVSACFKVCVDLQRLSVGLCVS